jgi:membrane associated rhomboid family serine protease
MPKIFGREPALWLALVAAVVYALGAFVFHLSDDQAALINGAAAALLGVVTAVLVHDGWSAAALGFVKALLSLALGFGLKLSVEQQLAVMTVATALSAVFVRTQASAPVRAVDAP